MTTGITDAMYRQFFENMPIIGWVVDEELRIVAITDRTLSASGLARADVIGRSAIEVFPDNPADPNANGTAVLEASLHRAFTTGQAEKLPRQRYDARSAPGGAFKERYWMPENVPVRDDTGRVAYVVHTVVRAHS